LLADRRVELAPLPQRLVEEGEVIGHPA
jgi:hypothetical protein